MISDARELGADASLTADVCIVGAGAAGITLALALRDSGLSVCVLEGGGFEITEASQALYEGTMSGIDTWTLDSMRARVFGGSTTWWSGWCRPLLPDDFEVRPYIPNSGWPLTYADLVPYYERAHRTLEIGDDFEYDPAVLSAKVGRPLLPFDANVIETRVYRFSPPTRFGSRYREDLQNAENVHVYVNANLRKIRLASAGGPVSHLECATLDGGHFKVEASRYVLALGGIENARLLLASNDEQAEGVANGSGLVGVFMEHPHFYASGSIVWKEAPDIGFYEGQSLDTQVNGESGKVNLVGGLGLALPVRSSERLPSFTATLTERPLDPENDDSSLLSPKSTTAVFGRSTATPSFVRLTYRCEQTSDDASRLKLTNEVDALGMPRLDLHWAIADSDEEARRRAFAIIARELGRLDLGRFWEAHLTPGLEIVASPGGHHLGTTRMSTDPKNGVVDGNGRAHEVSNLYITGSSVFSTGGDSNPTLTIVALAHRLADHLKNTGEA